MTTSQRRSTSFDSRSVMLFTALALGSMGALQAQNVPAQATSAAPGAPLSSSPSAPANRPGAQAAAAAFERADTNKDGELSVQEAAQLPAIAQRFKELDTDQNGSLSRAEFDKGANS